MEKALRAVIIHKSSIRRAALDYSVPKSTLGDRVLGRVQPGSRSGPERLLSDTEEAELVAFVRRCSAIGYPKTRKDMIELVQRIAESRGVDRQISNGWWEKFCTQNPSITLRASVPLSKARAEATDSEIIDGYFDLLEKTMAEYDLLDKPCQVFNADESGFPLAPKPLKAVHCSGEHTTHAINSGNKAQITVLACVSAGGHSLPSMVIWDKKVLSPELTNGEIPGTIYGLSDKGWIDQELFKLWFHHHFLRYAPTVRPLLLLMDGHSSHYFPDTIHMAAKEKVVLFVLPPNTTHLTQPLDKGCFSPLKAKWSEVCHKYTTTTGKAVNRFVFSKLLNEAWKQSMSTSNIIGGFKTTGVHPIDRTAITIHPKETAAKDELGFIPLCSPMPSALEKPRKLPTFTEVELERFQERYELEAKNPQADNRYQQWVKMYHPDQQIQEPDTTSSTVKMLMPAPTPAIEKFFPVLPNPVLPSVKSVSCGRVLTNCENLKFLEEKKQKKDEEINKKEERKGLREERKMQKEQQQSAKKQQRKTKATGLGTIQRHNVFRGLDSRTELETAFKQ
ncbi:uncharacterized protein [Dysidea avara]|uniref:uncharacterized protein n=1 Tax=Dysidea avara TaxID=196820 RepID=UPI003331B95D